MNKDDLKAEKRAEEMLVSHCNQAVNYNTSIN